MSDKQKNKTSREEMTTDERDQKIVREVDRGIPKSTVAKKYGITRQRVFTIYQDAKKRELGE